MDHPITRASLNLTRACNLACSYCFTNGCTSGDMSLDIAKKAVDFLIENAKKCMRQERQIEISFWGGEPLLKWSLLQNIASYAKEKSAQVAVPVSFGGTTNGVLLTPEKLDFLDEYKIFFMVSLDGTPESHNKYRKFHSGKGSQEIIIENMKHVLKKWPFYKVRMGPYAEGVHRFFEDCKYLFDFGFNYLVFSPVYEGNWTDQQWQIFEEQAKMVVDYMAELMAKGRKVEIEHFKSYMGKDNSPWPCGAGRFYVGIDIDGAIYPCHRFNKFNDERPWQEKEVCIGHIDHGITRPEFRQQFIDFQPSCKGKCPRLNDTPCNGGCYATNFDHTGDVTKAAPGICKYTEIQKRISEYYKEKIDMENQNIQSCICNNMCYLEGTLEEIKIIDPSTDATCICNNANYSGSRDLSVARALTGEEREKLLPKNIEVNPSEVLRLLQLTLTKLNKLEEQITYLMAKQEEMIS